MNLFLLLLGIIDLCGALLLLFGPNFPLIGGITLYFAYMLLVKGMISIFTSFPWGYFDWMGICDLIAGICLLLIAHGINYQTFGIFSIIYALKVAYALFRTILNI